MDCNYNKFDRFVNNVMLFVFAGWFNRFNRFLKWINIVTWIIHDNIADYVETMMGKCLHWCLQYCAIQFSFIHIMAILWLLPIQFSWDSSTRYPWPQLQEYDPTEFMQSMFRPHEPLTAHSSISALKKLKKKNVGHENKKNSLEWRRRLAARAKGWVW